MKRLVLHLKDVEKVKDDKGKVKLYNTLSFVVKDQREADEHLAKYGDKVTKHHLGWLK